METIEELKKEVLRLKQELSEAVETIEWHSERAYVHSCNSDTYEKAYNAAKERIVKLKEKMNLKNTREKERLDKAYAEIRALKGEDPAVLTD